jgi:hypothetical protein
VRLHMILNMPAVLSDHKIGKRERDRESGGGNPQEVGEEARDM